MRKLVTKLYVQPDLDYYRKLSDSMPHRIKAIFYAKVHPA